jgi:DNA-binding NtrC family response regulator
MPRAAHRILVVDDEPDMVATVGALLRRAAYESLQLTSATKALALEPKEIESFDLLLTDYHMADLNGIELARQLMEVNPRLKVILMSGTPWVEESAREAGFTFLPKPFVLQDLVESLRVTLSAAA